MPADARNPLLFSDLAAWSPGPALPASGALIGCAGWSIAAPVAARFPGTGSHLERYARVMHAVEINSSFYRPHRPATYARWAESVPAGFRFSVKLPRSITHDSRLVDVDAPLAQFALEATHLGDKLGCVLVQLAPSLQFDAGTADAFFGKVTARFACAVACEARHETWFSDTATALLRAHRIVRVIADPATGQPGPHVPTTSTVYLRLHGSPQRYYSAYAPEYLGSLSQAIGRYCAAGRQVWCIFDNTAAGAALPNALATCQACLPGLGMAG